MKRVLVVTGGWMLLLAGSAAGAPQHENAPAVAVIEPAQEPTPSPGAPGKRVRIERRMQGPGHRPMAPHAPMAPRGLGKWWKNTETVKELELTDAQISQIEANFLDHRLKLIDLRADLERQETKLQPLIEADQPDEAKVSTQLDLVVTARGRLEKANAMMMLAIRRTLSVEQWKKLEARQHVFEREIVVEEVPGHGEEREVIIRRREGPARPRPPGDPIE